MRLYYLWNIFIAAVTTLLIVEYNWSLWTWLITFAFSIFEVKKDDSSTKV